MHITPTSRIAPPDDPKKCDLGQNSCAKLFPKKTFTNLKQKENKQTNKTKQTNKQTTTVADSSRKEFRARLKQTVLVITEPLDVASMKRTPRTRVPRTRFSIRRSEVIRTVITTPSENKHRQARARLRVRRLPYSHGPQPAKLALHLPRRPRTTRERFKQPLRFEIQDIVMRQHLPNKPLMPARGNRRDILDDVNWQRSRTLDEIIHRQQTLPVILLRGRPWIPRRRHLHHHARIVKLNCST
jgi:hypothetical protein